MRKKSNTKWHPTKNIPLTPYDVSAGSYKKVWWICDNGHEWKAPIIRVATYGHGCPFCTGRSILEGYNDLVTLNPALAKEWDYSKNTLNPHKLAVNSEIKAWWKCGKCGRGWEALIRARNSGQGCTCTAKENRLNTLRKNKIKASGSFADRSPALAREWHPVKNGTLKPDQITLGAELKVWWLCSECKHEWQAFVGNRHYNGAGCVECRKKERLGLRMPDENRASIAEKCPDSLQYWNKERNAGLMPDKVSYGSKKKVWWKCKKGHEWQASLLAFTYGSRCPYCARKNAKVLKGYNDLATTHPHLV